MIETALDLDAVRAFVLIADLGSFTRAAEALDMAQAAVSLRLKRLEAQLSRRLVERTPRRVALSADGAAFLPAARELLAAQVRALDSLAGPPLQRHLRIGFSDHVAGPDLPFLIARLRSADPQLTIAIEIASSRPLAEAFAKGALDAAFVRREAGLPKGRPVREDRLAWFAAPGLPRPATGPLPVATLAAPCGVRAQATRALDAAGLPWREVFVGGGVLAVSAAVMAGIGVAALAERVAPVGAIDVTAAWGLPRLPTAHVIALSRVSETRAQAAFRTLLAALRGAAG